jgi:Kef-type K+ transport system membrane component KefB
VSTSVEPSASSADLTPEVSRLRTLLFYVLTIGGGIALFFLVREAGESLVAPAAAASTTAPGAGHGSVFAHVLLVLAVVTLFARGLGYACQRWLGQPPVIGEIVAGIALGPSILGAISQPAHQFLLPTEVAPYLSVVAKIGVVLFMFLVGLELDVAVLRGRQHATLAISHASIVVPFVLGAVLALVLYPLYGQAGVPFTVFALFSGISMSVTAFPVLARILSDRRMTTTPLGVVAIACAAVDDATAWCLLAFVSGVARAELGSAGITVALVVLHVLVVFFVARPIVRWLADREEKRTGPVSLDTLAIVFAGLLLSSVATEAIGIHALFGAFLLGAMIPHEGRLASQLKVRMEDVVGVLLLPVFFAFSGMRTQIGLLDSARDWLLTGLIIVVATAGKFGGTWLAARFAGMDGRQASALGVLMNTRGLMELIVLNVGLDMGVLSPRLFAMMVLMALVTTFMTSPVLAWLMPSTAEPTADEPAPAG